LSPAARLAAAFVWFGALALVYGLGLGPEEGGDEVAEPVVIAVSLAGSATAGWALRGPALVGPPAGLLLLILLYAAGVELPLFVSSALWAVGAFLLVGLELPMVGLGIAARWIVSARRRGPDGAPGRAYNSAP
jgi:hypothetical protein